MKVNPLKPQDYDQATIREIETSFKADFPFGVDGRDHSPEARDLRQKWLGIIKQSEFFRWMLRPGSPGRTATAGAARFFANARDLEMMDREDRSVARRDEYYRQFETPSGVSLRFETWQQYLDWSDCQCRSVAGLSGRRRAMPRMMTTGIRTRG